MQRVICAGHVNWDVTLRVDTLPAPDGEARIDGQTQAGGGSAANTAVVLAGLEFSPVLLGAVGDDQHGELARRELAAMGVECSPLQTVSGPTTVKYLVVDEDGEVMVLANDGVNEQFEAADLPETTLADAAHLHLTSQAPATAQALAERAAAAGLSVSFDPGRRLGKRDFDAVIEAVDIAFFNDREAAVADDGAHPDVADTLTVVTSGEGGATAIGTDEVSHPGFDVETVDTAGAGDAFAAGFLAAKLAEAPLDRALEVGNACGALAVRDVGARTDISWTDVERFCNVDFRG